MKLTNKPPKGTCDWFPNEFQIRKHIFDTWRNVLTSYGYEEYLTSIIESADVYKAKSGEDVGGKELMIMTDKAGRELAIRPEMTPSVTRMITRIYNDTPKPIRYFSIANFLRNEKPQRGRNREFWQLNFDIFGSDSIQSDVEVLEIALEIMLAFNPPERSFTLFINNRKLIDEILNSIANIESDQRTAVVRILDKWEKLSKNGFAKRLQDEGVTDEQITVLTKFMQSTNSEELVTNIPEIKQSKGFKETLEIIKQLEKYSNWISFNPSIIRGFDYYDGMVFEVFDNHLENSRALFGGGRYNGLAGIFGSQSFPAVGCAPGDEPTKLFLEAWDLIPKNLMSELIYIPLLDEKLLNDVRKLSAKLREQGKNVLTGFERQRLNKALDFANKKDIQKVIIFGEDEKDKGIYKVKNMSNGGEEEINL